jgi:hypothetical protein
MLRSGWNVSALFFSTSPFPPSRQISIHKPVSSVFGSLQPKELLTPSACVPFTISAKIETCIALESLPIQPYHLSSHIYNVQTFHRAPKCSFWPPFSLLSGILTTFLPHPNLSPRPIFSVLMPVHSSVLDGSS